jgi:hypothetical protein
MKRENIEHHWIVQEQEKGDHKMSLNNNTNQSKENLTK